MSNFPTQVSGTKLPLIILLVAGVVVLGVGSTYVLNKENTDNPIVKFVNQINPFKTSYDYLMLAVDKTNSASTLHMEYATDLTSSISFSETGLTQAVDAKVKGYVEGSTNGSIGKGEIQFSSSENPEASFTFSFIANENGEASENYDPCNDVEFLEKEIDLWYLDVMKRGWEKISRVTKQQKGEVHEALANHLSSFRITKEMAKDSMVTLKLDIENFDRWTEEEYAKLAVELRKRTKPIIIAANKMDLPKSKENIERIKKKFPHHKIVACSGDAEIALRLAAKAKLIEYMSGDSDFKIKGDLNEAQTKGLEKIRAVLKEFDTTGVQNVLDSAVFDFLQYIAIFPGSSKGLTDSKGNVMPDCYLMPPNTTAIDFAFRLHTDFGKNFLFAIDVRTNQRIGREHKLKHRDVIEIVSAAK